MVLTFIQLQVFGLYCRESIISLFCDMSDIEVLYMRKPLEPTCMILIAVNVEGFNEIDMPEKLFSWVI